MESFFFNITDSRYKITELFKNVHEHITRVDISNGVVFLDISLTSNENREFHIKNLDRMVMLCVVKGGALTVSDNIQEKDYLSKNGDISIYCSSRQDLTLTTKKNEKSDIFILFLADFF